MIDTSKPLEQMSNDELKELAREKGLADTGTHAQIMKRIKDSRTEPLADKTVTTSQPHLGETKAEHVEHEQKKADAHNDAEQEKAKQSEDERLKQEMDDKTDEEKNAKEEEQKRSQDSAEKIEEDRKKREALEKRNSTEAEEKNAEVRFSTATVKRNDGFVMRTYTREIHGENFKDLAHQYAEQYNGATVVMS